jgi:hypothetical protein
MFMARLPLPPRWSLPTALVNCVYTDLIDCCEMAWLLRLWLSIDHFDLLDDLLASCGTQVTLFWLVLLVAIVVEASIHALLFIYLQY